MKTVIFYSSKGGCSKECAEILKKHMGEKDVTVVDVLGEIPDMSSFDLIILGGGVRFGKLYKPFRTFMKKYSEEIAKKPHVLFLCCGFLTMADEYLEKLFPEALTEGAISLEYFGGELKPEKHNGFMKFVVRWIRNSIADREDDNDLPDIIESNISLLATKILSMKRDIENDTYNS